jgi:hypothetical protein
MQLLMILYKRTNHSIIPIFITIHYDQKCKNFDLPMLKNKQI